MGGRGAPEETPGVSAVRSSCDVAILHDDLRTKPVKNSTIRLDLQCVLVRGETRRLTICHG